MQSRLFLISALSVGVSGCAIARHSEIPPGLSGAAIPAEYKAQAARLEAFVAADSANAVSVAVVRDGRILWERGFGWANIASRVPASAQSIYAVASVSKSLTATAFMLLVQRGDVDLDAPASRYLEPGLIRSYVGSQDSMTVRSLLNMTGGIPHLVRFYWNDRRETPLGEAELLRRFGFSAFPPGTGFHYSNLSFEVLRHIMTRVSGSPSESFMARELFSPLGMAHTALSLSDDQKAFEALPYNRGEAEPLPLGGLEPSGGAGFHSSAHDLVLLASALMGEPLAGSHAVVSPSSARQMWDFRQIGWYGLGWWRDFGDSSHVIVLADGSALGGAATLALIPSQKLAVAVLMNRGSESTVGIAHQLLHAAIPPHGVVEVGVPPLPPLPKDGPFVPTPDWRGLWIGSVRLPEGMSPLRIDVRSDSVFAQLGNNPVASLESAELSGLGVLEGSFAGTVATDATANHPHRIRLALERRGQALVGHITAESSEERPHFMLPYFAQLTRVP